MRTYECVYILDPSLEELAVKDKTEKFKEIVTSRGGTVHKVDLWGKRKLAYPIAKRFEGSYILMSFEGDNEILAELNRVYRFDDMVLRHLIVIDDNPMTEQPARNAGEDEE
ncbi:MAG TPA: 30S ribosomal protein S6 [Candidatus Eisenbacteria bacterium]|uniref:Small ribosomal subunit protein bS6 n=1 Tax=Eiseniibacteriota bacterium TaxID=2212470 RepID=A0A7V2F479_UNCEI|nr:30S ribosomal protein S6 [Candidatus Eisenbacteria bacterium]